MVQVMSSPSADLRATPRRRAGDDQATFLSRWLKVWVILLTVVILVVVGDRIGMSPLTVIFALLAFGHLFGFVGVLIALPVSAVLVVAARRLRATYVESELFRG